MPIVFSPALEAEAFFIAYALGRKTYSRGWCFPSHCLEETKGLFNVLCTSNELWTDLYKEFQVHHLLVDFIF